MKKLRTILCMVSLILLVGGIGLRAFAALDDVYRVRIEGTIDLGLAHYASRAIQEANDRGGKAILLEINTFGGRVDAATQIRDAIYNSKIPVVAFVNTRAWSAGALIALACPHIVMSEGSSIGAAEPIPTTPKTISALQAELCSEAERYKRDCNIASGMANPDIVIPDLKNKGEILSLSAQNALKHGFADKIANSESEIAAFYAWGLPNIHDITLTKSERFTRFITNPDVTGILLTLGILGLYVELTTQHVIAGILGLIFLGLFFGGHMLANLSDTWFVLLFLMGIVLLLFEFHVLPGHGVSGLLGICAILASLFMVLGGNSSAMVQLFFSLGVATLIFILILRFLPKSPLFHKLILQTSGSPSSVIVKPAIIENEELVGKRGVTLSSLRPSGIVLVENKRYSAISPGGFLESNVTVRVTGSEGSSIIVTQDQT